MEYGNIAKALTATDVSRCTFIKTVDLKSAERIIRRALLKGWWFASWQCEGEQHIAFSFSIDLEKDLRRKLPNIRFELD